MEQELKSVKDTLLPVANQLERIESPQVMGEGGGERALVRCNKEIMADDTFAVISTNREVEVATSSETEIKSLDKVGSCQKQCTRCGFFNHVRRNVCTECDHPFLKRKAKEPTLNKQPASKTKERMFSYANQLHLKGYDVVIMTRKNNKKNPIHGSTWLWGSDGIGAAFANTKICSLAAKGFGSFVPTSNAKQSSQSQTPTPTSSHTTSDAQTSNTCTTPEISSNQSSSQIQVQLVQAQPSPTSLDSGSVSTTTSSSSTSSESFASLNQEHSRVVTSSSPPVPQTQANTSSYPISSDQQSLPSNMAHFQGRSVALLDDEKRVHAYGVVTGQSTVHGRAVQPGYLAVTVTSTLKGCTLSPVVGNHFEEGIIMEGGFYIWPMTRLALPSHLRPVTNM